MNKTKAGYIEGIISIIINIFLFVIKMWASIVTGSIALAADAWHTLSDSLSSIIVVVAAKLSSQKPDKKHPFGHGRWELIASFFIAVILGIIAYNFVADSIEQFNNKTKIEYGTIAIVVTIISIAAKELLAQYAFYLGRKTGNISVRADGWHHRSDALSSILLLIGILFASQFWWIDSVLGIIIGGMLFYATFTIMKETITKLLGEEVSQDLIDKIKAEVSQKYSNDLQLHHFHIHNYIVHSELTLHIRLNKDLTIEAGHQIANDIEEIIKEKFDIEATIHIDPL